MKSALPLRVMLTVIFLCSVLLLQAQYHEEKHDRPMKGTWYPEGCKIRVENSRSVNPLISNMIAQVSPDSIRATIQHLQDYGTRFMLNENRKEVAHWIADRFRSFGYNDIRLDSFLNYAQWGGNIDTTLNYAQWGGNIDTTWQYNVVCTAKGTSAPDEVYIIGGHYDSYCSGDPMVYAPGANDNGTAVAATLEIARVMKENGFVPEATVKFTLFAAEELGLWGSRYNAEHSYTTGEDIRMMMNMDMISNNPDSISEVKIYRYMGVEWAGDLAADVFDRYTTLDVFYPQNLSAGGSDSYPFWGWGFPVYYLEEMDFSPHWHQPSDTAGNCNFEYCAEIARGCFATLLDQELLPYPQGLLAESDKQNITVTWKPTENANVAGVNVYRSDDNGAGFVKINQQAVPDSFYVDEPPQKGKVYYYYIKNVSLSQEESLPSLPARGSVFAFDDTLLVVAVVPENTVTPDSIHAFYDAILDTIPYVWVDHTPSLPVDLGTLSRHQNLLMLLNTRTYDLPGEETGQDLISFFSNGGNMMVAGFSPSYFFAHNTTYPWKVPDYYFFSHFFKVDSVNRKVNSFMDLAYPVADEYDTLRVDTSVVMVTNHQGEIYGIEVYTPTAEGKVLYRFNSPYPANTTFGFQQDKAVGLEYMGDDFKTILLSFPLLYLDTADGKKLLKYVLNEKFTHPTGIIPAREAQMEDLTAFPNPASGETTLRFVLDIPSDVRLAVYDMQGKRVANLVKGKQGAGEHHVRFVTGSLSPGVYSVILQTERSASSVKLMIIP